MRFNIRYALLAVWIVTIPLAASCQKKAPVPPPAPPAAQPTPAPPTPTPTPTPTNTEPTTPPASVSDLKTVYFSLDSYDLDDAARAVLDQDARLLRDHADLTVRVEGHCDERGTVEYNMSLGQKRADAVRAYLVAAGVNGSRLSTISYGKERPVDEGHDEAAWSKNRRCEFSKP